MRNAIAGAALTVALGMATPSLAAPVGPVINPANGHSYYVLEASLTWADAEAQAVILGGHLVTINDTDENAWILANLVSPTGIYWTGLNDSNVEGSFEWVSGEPVAYTNWIIGEPDDDQLIDGNGDFVYYSGLTGTWGDTNGVFLGFVTGAIFELPASTVVPLPAAAWLLGSALLLLPARRRQENLP